MSDLGATIRLVLACSVLTLAPGCAAMKQQQPAELGAAASRTRNATESGRVMIRSGALLLRAKDPISLEERVETVTGELGGHVQDWTSRDRDWLAMTLRVPEPRLEEAMDRIGELGIVTGRTLRSQDVTEEMIDLEARLANLRALRDRLRSYLDRAADLTEILAVERELARVQSELEALEAKLALLTDRVALSELSVQVSRKRWFR